MHGTGIKMLPTSNRIYDIDWLCSRLYYLGLCKYTLRRSYNDEIASGRISQNVSTSFSDAGLYLYRVMI